LMFVRKDNHLLLNIAFSYSFDRYECMLRKIGTVTRSWKPPFPERVELAFRTCTRGYEFGVIILGCSPPVRNFIRHDPFPSFRQMVSIVSYHSLPNFDIFFSSCAVFALTIVVYFLQLTGPPLNFLQFSRNRTLGCSSLFTGDDWMAVRHGVKCSSKPTSKLDRSLHRRRCLKTKERAPLRLPRRSREAVMSVVRPHG
jgi:hypothetical protein